LRQASIYVDSHAPDANRQLEATFAAVAGEAGAPDGTLTVEHRRIKTVRQTDDVVWFTFHDLCEGPRSQDDYMELASWFHTLFVSNVPCFDEHSENAARRLIALVDVLYDHNVNLIVSAAAPPTELYRGAKLKVEFQRTASRLVEMQTEEYLARAHRP
jgi:cell division protein ZapE